MERRSNKPFKLDLLVLILYIVGYFLYKDKSKCIIFFNKSVCVYDILLTVMISVFTIGYLGKINKTETEKYVHPRYDWWAVSHFLLYTGLGYFFPDKLLMFFTLGIVWEIFEWMNSEYNVTLFGMELNNVDSQEGWWYGRSIDIIFNMSGYILGSYFAGEKLTYEHIVSQFIY
jgi:hypothetical protein